MKSRAGLRADIVAGLTSAISNLPSGMAAAALAGVSPAYGLTANIAGPVAGGLTTGTRLMVVNTSNPAALMAASTLAGVAVADRPQALFLLTMLSGAVMIVAGLLRLGRYTRFVSHAVMLGFLTGLAVNIVCGQLPKLAGADASGSSALAKAFDVAADPARIDMPSVLTGAAALLLMVAAARLRLAVLGPLLALLVPSVVVAVAGAESVARVSDSGAIARGVPLPHLPELGLMSADLVTGAVAIAVIVLVQGVGVAEATADHGGEPPRTDRDFIAQGLGNLAAGLFRGPPVGGSVAQTALVVSSGAVSRAGPTLAGAWMLLIVVVFSGVVGMVAMPTLGAVLIFAAIRSVRVGELGTVLRTGTRSQIAAGVTFTATLFLPVALAVGLGVALSLLMQLNREAVDLKVVELVPEGDRGWSERPAPEVLTGHRVTVLDVYGSLFYAGSRTLLARLPDPAGAESPVVVLRLRGRTSLGATFFLMVADYARRLAAAGGRLYLSGLDHDMAERLRRTRRVEVSGPVRLFEATTRLGESTEAAYLDADAWVVRHRTVTPGR